MNIYDVIIIGGGAAGLFCAACHAPKTKGLILEKSNKAGTKLLMSGSGQCNFTHAGDIKHFLNKYGQHGQKIRTALYKFNNLAAINYFERQGLKSIIRDDGKVFPATFNSNDILNILLRESFANGFEILYENPVTGISFNDGVYTVSSGCHQYHCNKLVIATGGCSYPSTGSDGNMFKMLKSIGLSVSLPKPALVPIFVQNYPYSSLSGVSFENVKISIKNNNTVYKSTGPLLFTFNSFSGPGILDMSRYAQPASEISINYFPEKKAIDLIGDIKRYSVGNKRSVPNFIADIFNIPVRFAEAVVNRLEPATTVASLSKDDMHRLAAVFTSDTFSISGTGGFKEAMATSGGVCLDEIDLRTFESKKYPRLHIIGEALDIDGNTGGYNIQAAVSTAYVASRSIVGFGFGKVL